MSELFSCPMVVGIAGGTGSGKTTVSDRIVEAVGPENVAILDQDSYYLDLSHIPLEERRERNFDHPDALEFPLLRDHVRQLKRGEPVHKPQYSFSTSTRTGLYSVVQPAAIIIVEGILIFWDRKLRDLMDIKIFVDTADDIRLVRRLLRDTSERGRSLEHVIGQYMGTVRPSHLSFVEPSKRYADLIIPEGGENKVAINIVVSNFKHLLSLDALGKT